MLTCAVAAAVAAVVGVDVSFKNYGDGYIQVVADGYSCGGSADTYKLQHNFDSTRIAGAAANPLSNTSYGIVKDAEDVAKNSGMFIPEFFTGPGARSIHDMWRDWTNGGENTDEVFSYKYSPTGRINLRHERSAAANEALHTALARLPGLENKGFDYTTFDKYYREPWTRRDAVNDAGSDDVGKGHEAFPGMMPAAHPLFDQADGGGEEGQRYAVKMCPGAANGECCLVVEGGKNGQKINPAGWGLDSVLHVDDSAGKEFRLKWRKLGYHTSFSRGIPDLGFYTPEQMARDFEKRPQGGDATFLTRLHNQLNTVQSAFGLASYGKDDGNEFKCKLPSADSEGRAPNYWSYLLASRLEHFYSAVVGAEEAGMLNQKIAEWDGQDTTKDYTDKGDGRWEADCKLQPGGHCGFGYYCADPGASSGVGECSQYRWRGRPEAIRFEGDNDKGEIGANFPFNSTFATYPHALDGEKGAWYDAEYRMSARLIWTGGDGHSQETELPCSITTYIDLVDNVAGDFTRACSKLRATKVEWLLAAMLQSHQYSGDLNRAGVNDQGFRWETNRGAGPTPCSYDPSTCYKNSINNRVKMWDLDQVWTLNNKNNNYQGPDEDAGEQLKHDDTYYKRLKMLRQVPGVAFDGQITPPMQRNLSASDLQFGASDGTSRTDPHAMSCYVAPFTANATGTDNDYFNKYGDSSTYYIAKPSLWPFQWGLSRSIGSDVDWNSPAGCDVYYGPPCRFEDAVENHHYSASYVGKGRRMASKFQGTDGVLTCGRISDYGRADWDNRNLKSRSGVSFQHGSHTCANLGNVTHFSVELLDGIGSNYGGNDFFETGAVEEWDCRATAKHRFGIRNCNIGNCQEEPVSIGCHFPMNDPDGGTHIIYAPGVTVEGTSRPWFFFNDKDRGAPEGGGKGPTTPDAGYGSWAQTNANGKKVNPNVAWVNWGKQLLEPKDKDGGPRDPQEGEKLSNMHTVYRNGKRDGILECEKPAEDLLLHSLLKSAKVCTTDTTDFMAASACRKPAEYAFWLQNHGTAHGFNAGPTTESFVYDNSGRVSGSENDNKKKCTCTAAADECSCGFLARTSRLVVGDEILADGIYARAEYPYKPHWIDDITETDSWCKDIDSGTNKAHKPRRVCRVANLEKTDFWKKNKNPITLDKIPSAFEREELSVAFVRRPNTAFNRAEFKHMENCVNSDDGQVCTDVPDLIQGLAIVAFKDPNDEVMLLKAVEEDFDCDTTYTDLQSVHAFKGFALITRYLIYQDNKYQLVPAKSSGTSATKVCQLVDNKSNNPDKDPGVWNVHLSSEGTIPLDYVQDKIDTYELLKITQCLEGSQSCPKITTSKRMNAGIPSTCQKPMISYVCDEETPNGITLKEPGSMISMEAIVNPSDSTVLRYTHEIGIACLNRINFFITCDDYTDERPALHSSLCTGVDCSLPQKFKMCHYNPFSDIFGENEHRLFRATFDPARFSGSEGAVLNSDCTCDQAMAIFSGYKAYDWNNEDRALISISREDLGMSEDEAERKRCLEVGGSYKTAVCGGAFCCVPDTNGTKCYVDGLEQSSYPSNLRDTSLYAAHICTSEYRRVELRDYRPNVGLQVSYGACDSLRVKYAAESDFQEAVVEPTRGFAPRGGDFRADLPVPLTRAASEQYGESGFTWKDGRLRELVPNACQNRFQTTGSAMFSRRLHFDRNPGEPMSVNTFGVCPENNQTFCAGKGHTYIKNMVAHLYANYTSFAKHFVRADACPTVCRATKDCVMASYNSIDSVCSLYRDHSGMVLLSTDDFGLFVEEPFTAVENGVDGIFLCMSPEAEQFIVPPPPPPPLQLCPSGHTFVKLPGAPSTCVRSVCDPETEMGVHIYPRKECSGVCRELCNAPGRDLSTRTTRQPAFWDLLDPPLANVDFSYSPELPLDSDPTFEFVFSGVRSRRVSELKKIELSLPPTRIVNCSSLNNFTDEMQRDTMYYNYTVEDPDGNVLAYGSGSQPLDFYPLDESPVTFVTIERSNHSESVSVDLDVPVQDYDQIHVKINVSQSASTKPLKFVVDGTECSCDQVNVAGMGTSSFNSTQHFENDTLTNPGNHTNATAFMVCRNDDDYDNTHRIGSAGYGTIFLCDEALDPEVCVPHSPCPERETYQLHHGTLEHDNVCAQQVFCTAEEVETAAATGTSARVCEGVVACTSLEYENASATSTSQAECIALSKCNEATKYRSREDNACYDITNCTKTPNLFAGGADPTPFSDQECTSYQVECTDSQYESKPRTASTDRECTEFTVCAPNEYSSLEASLTSDRVCQPMLECGVHQIRHAPGDFESDIFCEPVVHFSISWYGPRRRPAPAHAPLTRASRFLGIAYAVVFVGVYAWMSFGRYKYMGYNAVTSADSRM
jgi:hypothetical protein